MRTHTAAWFILAVALFVAGFVAHGTAGSMLIVAGVFAFVAACLRATVLSVRDDDVSASTIRGPMARTLAIWGADSRSARRGRRTARARRRDET